MAGTTKTNSAKRKRRPQPQPIRIPKELSKMLRNMNTQKDDEWTPELLKLKLESEAVPSRMLLTTIFKFDSEEEWNAALDTAYAVISDKLDENVATLPKQKAERKKLVEELKQRNRPLLTDKPHLRLGRDTASPWLSAELLGGNTTPYKGTKNPCCIYLGLFRLAFEQLPLKKQRDEQQRATPDRPGHANGGPTTKQAGSADQPFKVEDSGDELNVASTNRTRTNSATTAKRALEDCLICVVKLDKQGENNYFFQRNDIQIRSFLGDRGRFDSVDLMAFLGEASAGKSLFAFSGAADLAVVRTIRPWNVDALLSTAYDAADVAGTERAMVVLFLATSIEHVRLVPQHLRDPRDLLEWDVEYSVHA